MRERYTQLFALPENLYTEGSPVIISAGHMLNDSKSGRIIVQLKLKNIDFYTIKAVTVQIQPLDTAGKRIDYKIKANYLDLVVEQGDEFGQKVAITIPNPLARGFIPEILQVVFTDHKIWEGNNNVWKPLPKSNDLSLELSNSELLNQFRMEFGEDSVVFPYEYKNIWLCKCGTWNSNEECYQCGILKDKLLPIDLNELKSKCIHRLEAEGAYQKTSGIVANEEDDEELWIAAEKNRIAKFKEIGEEVIFGKYPQQNQDLAEEVEWIVLDTNGEKSLLISKKAIDSQEYNNDFKDITWAECTLRNWLNHGFLQSAFSKEELSAICITHYNDNSKHDEDIEDKVFLLSEKEIKEYYPLNQTRTCQITPYAEEKGAYCNKIGKGWWWLRSSIERNTASCVDTDGKIKSVDVDNTDCAVRPAIWINTAML